MVCTLIDHSPKQISAWEFRQFIVKLVSHCSRHLYSIMDKCELIFIIINLQDESLTIHFSHSFDKIIRILETKKSITLALICLFVPNNFCLQQRWILCKCSGENFVSNFIAKITTEHSEIIWNQKKSQDAKKAYTKIKRVGNNFARSTRPSFK